MDYIANRLLPKPAVSFDPNFDPGQSVTDRQLTLVEASDELTVIVPPWHAHESVQQRLAHRHQMLGRSTLLYGFHDDILNTNPVVTVKAFENIADVISVDVNELAVKQGLQPRFIATSLGTAILPYAMGERQLSGNAELVVPGHNLAESLWHGIRTQHLRKAYEQQGYDLRSLKVLWSHLSSTYQAERHIKNSDFTLHLSESDLVIPSRKLFQLVFALKASGNTVTVNSNRRLGHYGTIVKHAYGF